VTLTLVALAVGAGLIFLLTSPASAGAAPVQAPPVPPQPILYPSNTPTQPTLGLGSSRLPNATTAITAGVAALLAWAITALSTDMWDTFAQQLGYRNEDALDQGLRSIGRDDLIRLKDDQIKPILSKSNQTPPVLGMPTGTSAEKVAVVKAWRAMVIAAFEQAGYRFPA
jgi:hypothetical protein